MAPLQAISTVLPLSFLSGINLYLTVLVIGLSIRFGWVTHAPSSLYVLGSPLVLLVAGTLYGLQFLADKIPFVDNVWDIIHTVIRPAGAVVLVTASLTGVDHQTQVIAAMVAGATALTSHGSKASTRTALNMTTPFENLTNILISLAEDLMVAGLAFLAFRHPVLANTLTVVFLTLFVVFALLTLRWVWFLLRTLPACLRALVYPLKQSEPLPPFHRSLLDERTPVLSLRCRAQKLKRGTAGSGYLSLFNDALYFTSKRRFRPPQVWQLPLSQVETTCVRSRLLVDKLEITSYNGGGAPQTTRFLVMKDRHVLLRQLVDRLAPAAAPASSSPALRKFYTFLILP